MVVFMGPWSGGKSTIINWLLGIEDEDVALRTGSNDFVITARDHQNIKDYDLTTPIGYNRCGSLSGTIQYYDSWQWGRSLGWNTACGWLDIFWFAKIRSSLLGQTPRPKTAKQAAGEGNVHCQFISTILRPMKLMWVVSTWSVAAWS